MNAPARDRHSVPLTPEQWAERIAAQCDAISERIEALNAGLRAGLEPFRCNHCGRMRPCRCDRAI